MKQRLVCKMRMDSLASARAIRSEQRQTSSRAPFANPQLALTRARRPSSSAAHVLIPVQLLLQPPLRANGCRILPLCLRARSPVPHHLSVPQALPRLRPMPRVVRMLLRRTTAAAWVDWGGCCGTKAPWFCSCCCCCCCCMVAVLRFFDVDGISKAAKRSL